MIIVHIVIVGYVFNIFTDQKDTDISFSKSDFIIIIIIIIIKIKITVILARILAVQ